MPSRRGVLSGFGRCPKSRSGPLEAERPFAGPVAGFESVGGSRRRLRSSVQSLREEFPLELAEEKREMTAEIPRRSFLRLAAATAVGGAVPAMKGGRPAYAQPVSSAEWEPDAVLAELREGNARHVSRHTGTPLEVSRWEDFAWGQAPRAVVLTCSDSRVQPEDIFDQSRGPPSFCCWKAV